MDAGASQSIEAVGANRVRYRCKGRVRRRPGCYDAHVCVATAKILLQRTLDPALHEGELLCGHGPTK